MIKPTIGRVVWCWPHTVPAQTPGMIDRQQPYTAQICYVHSDHTVNLAGFDHKGLHWSAQNVPLIQEGEEKPEFGVAYCEWMPYQKGQAARTEEVARIMANAVGSSAGT